MFQIWKMLYQVLLDERGEDAPAAGGAGQGQPPADAGLGQPPAAGVGQEGNTGDGQGAGTPPVLPAFGEFGDTPKTLEEATALLQKVYDTHTKIVPEYNQWKQKLPATERNLAQLRQTLKASGIQAVQGEDGQIRLEVVNQTKQERKQRFQDTHKSLFDEKVLEAIRFLVQDEFDNGFDTRQKEYSETTKRTQVLDRMRSQAVSLMFAYFPQLDGKWDDSENPTNPNFDAKLHQRATEIWKEKYGNNPQGELMAALEAAKELNIPAQAIVQAEKKGFQAGQAQKKILGPVGQGSGARPGGQGQLSKEEYLKLPPEQRITHDKRQLGIS